MSTTPVKIPQLVILSGKGGTGKTSISAAFVHLCESQEKEKHLAIIDADVDAANLNLVLHSELIAKNEFWGASSAEIISAKCSGCGDCVKVCRYDAILPNPTNGDTFQIDPMACDGCAACVYACQFDAIEMKQQLEGHWLYSKGDYGMLFHAELLPGRENSGKLVSLVKQKAQKWAKVVESPFLIIDGPPGIGCPVIAACVGVDLALIVAEPGQAGYHDLKRIYSTLDHFRIPTLLCINKADLYPKGSREIQQFAQEENIKFIGEIPFDANVQNAICMGMPVTKAFPSTPASQKIETIWLKTRSILEKSIEQKESQ